jgi:hypothetical protein
LSRLISKRRQDFAPASPTTYKRRFLQALREFLAYTKNPTMTWNKSSKSPATKNKSHQRPTTKEKLLPEPCDQPMATQAMSPCHLRNPLRA